MALQGQIYSYVQSFFNLPLVPTSISLIDYINTNVKSLIKINNNHISPESPVLSIRLTKRGIFTNIDLISSVKVRIQSEEDLQDALRNAIKMYMVGFDNFTLLFRSSGVRQQPFRTGLPVTLPIPKRYILQSLIRPLQGETRMISKNVIPNYYSPLNIDILTATGLEKLYQKILKKQEKQLNLQNNLGFTTFPIVRDSDLVLLGLRTNNNFENYLSGETLLAALGHDPQNDEIFLVQIIGTFTFSLESVNDEELLHPRNLQTFWSTQKNFYSQLIKDFNVNFAVDRANDLNFRNDN